MTEVSVVVTSSEKQGVCDRRGHPARGRAAKILALFYFITWMMVLQVLALSLKSMYMFHTLLCGYDVFHNIKIKVQNSICIIPLN